MAMTYGSLTGLVLVAVSLIQYDSIAPGADEGLVLGAMVGLALALLGPGRTPISTTVAVEDVPLVIETVRRGKAVPELRLADPVLHYSRDVRARLDRDRFFCWVPPLLMLLTFSFAVTATAFGTAAGVVISWAAFLSWIALAIWIPLRRSAALERAQQAESSALGMLAADFASRSIR